MNELLPYVFSVLSMIFYTILTFPQIYLILKLKSSDSVSLLTLLAWCTADTINLIGVIFLKLERVLYIIGWYHLMMSYLLLTISVIYNHVRGRILRMSCMFIIFTELVTAIVLNILMDTDVLHSSEIVFVDGSPNGIVPSIGYLLGWISVVLYITSRFPQIYLNNKNKTTYGLSMSMFIFATLGNIFYMLSIVSVSIESDYLLKNLPWIILCFGCTFLDIIIILQCILYVN